MPIKEIPKFPLQMDDKIVVGVGNLQVSDDPQKTLVTFSLGSCVAVSIYDPIARVGGMLHAMLPEAEIAMDRHGFNPHKYVNSGLPLLFKECYALGAKKNRIKVNLAGCSNVLDNANYFNIGKRNYVAARKNLWKNNVLIQAEYCDANESITMFLDIGNGNVTLKIKNRFFLLEK